MVCLINALIRVKARIGGNSFLYDGQDRDQGTLLLLDRKILQTRYYSFRGSLTNYFRRASDESKRDFIPSITLESANWPELYFNKFDSKSDGLL